MPVEHTEKEGKGLKRWKELLSEVAEGVVGWAELSFLFSLGWMSIRGLDFGSAAVCQYGLDYYEN